MIEIGSKRDWLRTISAMISGAVVVLSFVGSFIVAFILFAIGLCCMISAEHDS